MPEQTKGPGSRAKEGRELQNPPESQFAPFLEPAEPLESGSIGNPPGFKIEPVFPGSLRWLAVNTEVPLHEVEIIK
jgi:hypothetical protein